MPAYFSRTADYAAFGFFCTGGVVLLIRRVTSSSLIVQMRSSGGIIHQRL